MKMLFAVILYFVMSTAWSAELPKGHASAEGVAADMATAFIAYDEQLWRQLVLPLENEEYQEFVENIAEQMQYQASQSAEEKVGLKEIDVIFKPAKLSSSAANSEAQTAYKLEEIGFVDVGVLMHNGDKVLNRTFVARKGNQWYALPRPDLFPQLTEGLNQESRQIETVYRKQSVPQGQ